MIWTIYFIETLTVGVAQILRHRRSVKHFVKSRCLILPHNHGHELHPRKSTMETPEQCVKCFQS